MPCFPHTMASRLTSNQVNSLSSANKFDLTHILDGSGILEKLHIILEDGRIVKPNSNYVEELTKLFNDRSQVDDEWLRIGSNYVYFFSPGGAVLPVIIVEPGATKRAADVPPIRRQQSVVL